jgi:hypothetical protein
LNFRYVLFSCGARFLASKELLVFVEIASRILLTYFLTRVSLLLFLVLSLILLVLLFLSNLGRGGGRAKGAS